MVLAGFVLVFGLELAFHAVVHGDALYRFTLLGGHPDDPMGRAANENLIYRLLESYPVMFAVPNTVFGLSGPLLALGGLYACFRLRESALFVLWAAAILLFYEFMTSSFSHYVALPAAPRLIAPACAPLAILTGKLLVDLWHWTAGRPPLVRRAARAVAVVGGTTIVGVSLLSMYLNLRPTLSGAAAQNAKAVARSLRAEPRVRVVSDLASARALRFYRGYRPDDVWLGFAAASQAPLPDDFDADPRGPERTDPPRERAHGRRVGASCQPAAGRPRRRRQLRAGRGRRGLPCSSRKRQVARAALPVERRRQLIGPWSADLAVALASDARLAEVRRLFLGRVGEPPGSSEQLPRRESAVPRPRDGSFSDLDRAGSEGPGTGDLECGLPHSSRP